jgi:hypothetical protein
LVMVWSGEKGDRTRERMVCAGSPGSRREGLEPEEVGDDGDWRQSEAEKTGSGSILSAPARFLQRRGLGRYGGDTGVVGRTGDPSHGG